ncbi:PREDICTED: acyl-coenzyme A thioesterase THEM4-like [Gekko japonicus]|uniref:Acyl-coenzyme A thioesterase THEM4 n=1 Tax=Gekko japonicus TaxID=146911 RepID=A0ABM1LH44_GEKJA|nr:PREDICTED: acyl-coenzyme A thioesterase THEM4-like [Gekko japonicus]
MHLVLRSCGRTAARLACRAAPRRGPQALACQRAWLGSTLSPASSTTPGYYFQASVHQSKQAKDYSLPNSSWSPDMMTQFNKYMEMSKDKTWKKLPSYRDILDHMPERMRQEHEEERSEESRMFLRNLDEEGKGFEYVMFLNWSEKRMACVAQLGPYLEGPPGFVHGGSIATILDSVLGGCAMSLLGHVMTANLNINYKTPVPLGSVVLAESKLDKLEGRKVFVSGHVRSVDGETLHAEATGLFIQLASQKTHPPPECSK